MKSIREIDVEGKTVLVRTDYNVPMKDGEITSDFRIRASLPTLEYLRENGAEKIIIISHLGRPEGRDKELSLEVVAERLNELVSNVVFVNEVSGDAVREKVLKMRRGEILVLENLRFYPGEKANDAEFIRSIIEATGAEIYVQDGFAVMHRAHASTDAIKKCLPVCMGLLLEHEVENLSRVMDNPERPFVFIIGGAKVEDKQPLIDKFAKVADKIIVGGKIAADGYKAEHNNIYVVEDFDEDSAGNKLDAGPVSMAKIAGEIADAKTIVWNGLMGKAEDAAYATASTIVAEMMGEKESATTIVCGGDTTGFVEELMDEHPSLDYTLLSTGGGAALEFLLRGTLVGLE